MYNWIIIYILISSINTIVMLVGLSKGVWKWVVLMLTLKLGIFPLNSYVIYIYRSIKIEKVFIMGK